MELKQELREYELEIMLKQHGYDSRTTQYHIEKYKEEFGDTEFIKKIRGIGKSED